MAQQMQEIAPDLLVAQLVRRPLIELGQPGDPLHVGSLGVNGSSAQVEFVDEFLA